MEYIDWIDEEGKVIDVLPRPEIRRRNLLHRVTATIVFHSDGRVFIHQRTLSKDVYPGLFDVMVGGTVSSGESFRLNAFRELEEELGVSGVPLYYLFQHNFRDEETNNLIHLFASSHDGPMTLQPEEVAQGQWGDAEEVESLITKGSLCPDSAQGWSLFKEKFGPPRPLADIISTHGLTPVNIGEE